MQLIKKKKTTPKPKKAFDITMADGAAISGKVDLTGLPLKVAKIASSGTKVLVIKAGPKDRSAIISAKTKRELTAGFQDGLGLVVSTTKPATSKALSLTVELVWQDKHTAQIIAVTASPTEVAVPLLPIQVADKLLYSPPSKELAMELGAAVAFWAAWIPAKV